LGQEIDGGAKAREAGGEPSTKALVTQYVWAPRQAFATRAYWMIVLGGIGCQFPFFFFTAHWLLHLKGAGISAGDAAWAMGLFTMGAVAGRLIGGWLMDRLVARYAFILGLCCYFVGSVLALRVSPGAMWIAYTAAILYGTGFGWTFVCMNTATGHFYGPAAFPKVNGMVLLLTGIFCSPAGFIGGKLFDIYGNYTLAFAINMIVAAVGVVALLFATRPEAPENARESALALENAS
jgi:MFS family permease